MSGKLRFDFSKDLIFIRDQFVEYCQKKKPEVQIIRTEKDKWYEV